MKTSTKQFSLEFFQSQFFTNVRFGYINHDLSVDELKNLIIDLRISLADTKPAYRRIQDNGNYYTAYNQIGKMIAQRNEYPLNHIDIVNCEDVHTHRQLTFNIADANRLHNKMIFSLAVRLNLKVFQNGNLYSESKKVIEKYLHS